MKNKYIRPTVLRKWTLDVHDGELYELIIFDNQKIYSTIGRYAHSSGATNFTWQQLLNGEFNSHITEIFGEKTLQEAKTFIQSNSKPKFNFTKLIKILCTLNPLKSPY